MTISTGPDSNPSGPDSGPDSHVSRRAVILAGVAATIMATGTVALAAEMERPVARRRRAAPVAPAAAAVVVPPPAAGPVRPHPTIVRSVTAVSHPPVWARRWHSPISRIDDFTHRSPATRFPRRAVMLTIDDGPSAEWTPRYLRLLERHHVRATFCMIGSQVHPNRHLARAVAEHGHAIANHTWTHDEQLRTRSTTRIRSEIERTSQAIHAATGILPTQFRAPGGAWGPRVYDELARAQLMPLGWDVDPRDWARPGTAAIEATMLAARRHDIILCHDGGGNRTQTYHALEKVIPALLRRGYEFVTLPSAATPPGSVSR